MNTLYIDKTPNTPRVDMNPETGAFRIEGRTIPENPGDFYDPITEWLEGYFENPAQSTSFSINLDYINSGSSKYLLGLFRIFKKKFQEGIRVEINWYFEEDDEAIEGLGEHYKDLMPCPFNMIEFI